MKVNKGSISVEQDNHGRVSIAIVHDNGARALLVDTADVTDLYAAIDEIRGLRLGPEKLRAREKRHDEIATALFDGPVDKVPRYREGIIDSIAKALDDAHQAGAREMYAAATERALRENVAIARGAVQAAEARLRPLELMLRDHLAATKK